MNPDAIKFTITSTVGIVDYSGRITLSMRNMAGQVVKTVVQNKLETKGVYSLGLVSSLKARLSDTTMSTVSLKRLCPYSARSLPFVAPQHN